MSAATSECPSLRESFHMAELRDGSRKHVFAYYNPALNIGDPTKVRGLGGYCRGTRVSDGLSGSITAKSRKIIQRQFWEDLWSSYG